MLQCGGDTRFGQLLHFAVERTSPDQLAIIDMLLAFGLPVNARMFENCRVSWAANNPYGMGTALHRAAELGKLEVATYLLDHGADPELPDSVGRLARDIATIKGHVDVVAMIDQYLVQIAERNSRSSSSCLL